MRKAKTVYRIFRYAGEPLQAKREISFETSLLSRLILDELCFNWNKTKLEEALNSSIDQNNEQSFQKLSEEYKQFVWE
ncbi:IDEAL domain-containing protein [Oceanobacillus sp. 1P07AA]|uniref:IDEAL domain-containing protein n=1 Tax=Oceanobacillus sp. 1P07AA TaxID=3132293 RepID=UPI0039A5950B